MTRLHPRGVKHAATWILAASALIACDPDPDGDADAGAADGGLLDGSTLPEDDAGLDRDAATDPVEDAGDASLDAQAGEDAGDGSIGTDAAIDDGGLDAASDDGGLDAATDDGGADAASADAGDECAFGACSEGVPMLQGALAVVQPSRERLLVWDNYGGVIIEVRLSDGARQVVLGDGHESFTALAVDEVHDRIYAIDLDPLQGHSLVSYDAELSNHTLVSASGDEGPEGMGRGAGPVLYLSDLALDAAGERAFLIEYGQHAVMKVDLNTGDRTLLTGSGPALEAPGSVGWAPLLGLVIVLDANREALVSVDPSTGARNVISDAVDASRFNMSTGSGPGLGDAERLVVNGAANVAYVRQPSSNTVLQIDLTTGDRTVLTEDADAADGPPIVPLALALDAAGERLMVTSDVYDSVFSVDLDDGARALVSRAAAGEGPSLHPSHLALAPDGSLLALGAGGLFTIELDTGNRILLSGQVGDEERGSGQMILSVAGLAYDVDLDRILVLDRRGHVLAIDPVTGDRTVVTPGYGNTAGLPPFAGQAISFENQATIFSDQSNEKLMGYLWSNGSTFQISGTGNAGPAFDSPTGVALDADEERAFVGDISGLLEVDLSTGDRAWVSRSHATEGVGTGPAISAFDYFVVDHEGGTVYVTGRRLSSIDLATGNRSIVSDYLGGVGEGPGPLYGKSVAVDHASGRVYVADTILDAVFAIDVATGDRTLISSGATH